jgi:hypothetical protein
MADGDIGAVIDTLEFDLTTITHPDMVHVSGDVYAIAYSGVDGDGQVVTIDIAADGQIGAAVIDSLEFDATDGAHPDIIHVSGDVYAIVYQGVDFDGFVCTVSIAADGQIGAAVIDSLEFDAAQTDLPEIIHVSGDVYAIIYQSEASDGYVCTVSIAPDGQIGAAVIDSLEFAATTGKRPKVIKVSNGIYAISYRGLGDDGYVCTISIATGGQIGAAVIDSLEFDAANGFETDICHVVGNIYAIAYRGSGDDGYVCTVSIAPDGQIGAAVIDSLEFDTVFCMTPNIILLESGICAIAYSGNGQDGWICTVQIEADGQIGAAVIDSLEFDISYCGEPNILRIQGDVYAIAYSGGGNDGFVKTLTIETPVLGKVQHLLMMGVG